MFSPYRLREVNVRYDRPVTPQANSPGQGLPVTLILPKDNTGLLLFLIRKPKESGQPF